MENTHILNLRITDLENSPFQGRLYSINDELPQEEEAHITELKASIENNGLMQPIVVRAKDDGKYEIIDGHRWVIAHRRLGRGQVRAIVKDYDDRQAQVFSLVGNLQRKDLSAIEQAVACQKILESGMFTDKRELSKSIGKDETYVGDLLAMLKMDERIITDMSQNNSVNDTRIMRMIRKAAPLEDEGISSEQYRLYKTVRDQKMNRKEAAKLIEDYKKEKAGEPEYQTPQRERLNIEFKKRTANVKIDMQGVQKVQREKIQDIVNERLKALEKEIREYLGEVY